jgi:hypothetical protein
MGVRKCPSINLTRPKREIDFSPSGLTTWDRVFERSWASEKVEICRMDGLPVRASIPASMARFLASCDGERSLGEVIQEFATSVGEDAGSMTPQALRLVRPMLENGLLLPPGIGNGGEDSKTS